MDLPVTQPEAHDATASAPEGDVSPTNPGEAIARRHPSLFSYSPAIVVLAIALADSARFADPDLWGHLRFGLDVLKSGRIVNVDPYSYTAFGHAWLNHEWLSEVTMGWLYTHMGVFGLKLLKFSCSAVAVLFIAAALGETGAPSIVQMAVLLTTSLAIAPQMQFRPQAFTFALLSALLYVLARDSYRGRAPVWIAIPMLALWANLHGGFILGLAALGTYCAAAGVTDLMRGRGPGRFIRLGAITAAATLATIATPYGIGTWTAVVHALRNPYTRAVVDDWQPFWKAFAIKWERDRLATNNYVMAAAEFLAMALAWGASPEADDAGLAAFAGLMAIASLLSIRNVPAMALALATPLARHLPDAMGRRFPAISRDSPPHERSGAVHQFVVVALAVFLMARSGFFSGALGAPDPYPVSAINFMRDHKLYGNILCHFGWGEYVIWHAAPESKVFIDGRYDTVFPIGVVRDFIEFNFNLDGKRNALEHYHNDFVLTDTKSPAHLAIESVSGWKLIYSDKDSMLFAPETSSAAHIAGVPVTGDNPPVIFP
jgi:hypothetical protein